jgi:hypothetical protein
MNPEPNLIGPAALVIKAAEALLQKRASDGKRVTLLFDGDPGVGKTTLADAIAIRLTRSVHAIEPVNGQSLNIDLVRQWRASACYGNMFAEWTVKRIDELDHASPAGMAELLTYLDTLPRRHAVIATTNDFAKLRAISKGRLESRFARFPVAAPSVDETVAHLTRTFGLTKTQAKAIALGSVPDGELPTAGCNIRTAENDADAFAAVLSVTKSKQAA